MRDYTILFGKTQLGLMDAVNERLCNGYLLAGGVFYEHNHSRGFLQAVYREGMNAPKDEN